MVRNISRLFCFILVLLNSSLIFSQDINKTSVNDAIELYNNGKIDESIKEFQKIIENTDQNDEKALSYYFLSNIYCYNKMDYDIASEYANLAINQADGDVKILNESYLVLVDVYIEKKDLNKAIDYANLGIKIQGSDEWNFITRANVFQLKTDYKSALADCNSAIKINPKNSSIYGLMGIIYYKQNSLDKALENYNKGIDLDPEYYGNYNNAAYVYFDQKKYNNAVDYFEKAIKLNSEYKDSYAGLAITYLRLNNIEQAKDNYNKAVNLDMNYAGNFKILIDQGMFYSDVEMKAFDEIMKLMGIKKK
jgi:tetratricopeptide (TPR) repeat protein